MELLPRQKTHWLYFGILCVIQRALTTWVNTPTYITPLARASDLKKVQTSFNISWRASRLSHEIDNLGGRSEAARAFLLGRANRTCRSRFMAKRSGMEWSRRSE